MLLQANHIEVSFGARDVLRIGELAIYDGERIGLVGENGAGKTTLLDVLAGTRAPDCGQVTRYCDIVRIEQTRKTAASPTGVEECLSHLSGGERTRLALTQAISSGAPLLLADEPTNDLDQDGLAWLESVLLGWKGALVLVSHDRMLLDNVCTCIMALEDGQIRRFPGNFSDWWAQRARERAFAQTEYLQARQEKARLFSSVHAVEERRAKVKKAPKRMGNSEARLHTRASTATQKKLSQSASAIQKRIEQIPDKQRPRDDPELRMMLGTPASLVSRTPLRVHSLSLGFGENQLLDSVSFSLPNGSRTALLGANGAGKTTLLRHIAARADGIALAPGVKLGIFDQDHAQLDSQKTALQQACMSGASETSARTVLARLGMRGDDVHKRTGYLSGGERAKVIFTMLMLSDANLLLLDEPTNHLDLFMLPVLEEVLAQWPGTMLFVSHDRAFVQHVATRLLLLEHTRLQTFEGTWRQYEETLFS